MRAAMAAADKTISNDETEEFVLYKDIDGQLERPACYSDFRYDNKTVKILRL